MITCDSSPVLITALLLDTNLIVRQKSFISAGKMYVVGCSVVIVLLCLSSSNAFRPISQRVLQRKCLQSSAGNEFGRPDPPKAKPISATDDALEKIDAELVEEEKRVELSDMMKSKLRREAQSLGGDPNAKSANPIAIIGGVVALLAVLSFLTGAIQ